MCRPSQARLMSRRHSDPQKWLLEGCDERKMQELETHIALQQSNAASAGTCTITHKSPCNASTENYNNDVFMAGWAGRRGAVEHLSRGRP